MDRYLRLLSLQGVSLLITRLLPQEMKREEQPEEWEEKQVKEIYKVVEDNPRVILRTELTVLK